MANNWFITDDDCLQCCRPIPEINPQKFEFCQINSFPTPQHGEPFYQVAHGTIDIHQDYSPEEIEDVLGFYGYKDLDDFVLQNSPTQEFVYNEDGTLDRENSPSYIVDYQLIAEMFFETECQEYVCEEYEDWSSAVDYIARLTGQDLSQYKTPVLSLMEKGREAIIMTDAEYYALPKEDRKPRNGICPVMEAPMRSADLMSRFLTSAVSAGYTPVITPAAMKHLPALMSPILDAGISLSQNKGWPIPALDWRKENGQYLANLDNVLNSLGLASAEYKRFSVTQGEVDVHFCGKHIVQYGDEMYLKLKNGKMSHHFRGEVEGEHYGPVIGGYGSIKPESYFRQAALTQYGVEIHKVLQAECEKDRSVKPLADLIKGAEAKAGVAKPSHGQDIDFSR